MAVSLATFEILFSYYSVELVLNLQYLVFEVVGTVEGGKAPTKIKTDLKKPIVNLACHPRLPVLVKCSF